MRAQCGRNRAAARGRGLRRLRRKLAVFYQGRAKSTPGYYRTGTGQLVEGRGVRHLRVGGVGIDATVADAFLAALALAGLEACLDAAEQLETGVDTALAQWRREVERAGYDASKAERRYLAVDPDNRLVARGLEADWEKTLQALADAEAELARREAERPKTLTPQEKAAILALGENVADVARGHHDRSGPQRTTPHPAGGGDHPRRP